MVDRLDASARRNRPVVPIGIAPPTEDEEEDDDVAVKLRLMRMGKKKQPTYRIVAADSRAPRDGRFIEIVGSYDPRTEPSGIRIDQDKARRWLRNGAKPTERVQKLLDVSGTLAEPPT